MNFVTFDVKRDPYIFVSVLEAKKLFVIVNARARTNSYLKISYEVFLQFYMRLL